MKPKTDHQNVSVANLPTFTFRKYDSIGNLSAESDQSYLSSCFVNNGELLEILRDCSDDRGIVVGRTGAGKSALLQTLRLREERAIVLNPHDLALGYISNSAVLTFFASMGVKMDLFYRALWRHVIVVELLKRCFKYSAETESTDPWEYFLYRVRRKRTHVTAIQYLRKHGTEFWNTTEELVKEITVKAERDLKAGVEVGLHQFIALGAEGASRLTTEQRREIHQLGQEVVNRTQMNQLSEIMKALEEDILTDDQKHYFILIDQLDEDWIDDQVRYRLLKALIETMREVNRTIRCAKVVPAIRIDLLERVLASTSDAGFQSEKYRDVCLPISWTRDSLAEVLDFRINQLVQNRYSSQEVVTHREVLPKAIGEAKQPTLDYILERTLMRPRDVIAFFNFCLPRAEGAATISPSQLLDAEGEYSRKRLDSVADEWSAHYPNLLCLCRLLDGRPDHFGLSDIEDDSLLNLSIEVLKADEPKVGDDYRCIQAFCECQISAPTLRAFIAHTLWHCGVIGVKTAPFLPTNWSHLSRDHISLREMHDKCGMYVHKMFWRALGIRPC